MTIGRKTGGRTAGTLNRKTVEIVTRLEALGCDPVAGMTAIALNESNAPELRGRMFAELAQYLYPKRKAVQHTGGDGEQLTVKIIRLSEQAAD